MWYAFIRPPIFTKQNAKRYSDALYYYVVKGSDDELPIIADEVGRSANNLVKWAKPDAPRHELLPPDSQQDQKLNKQDEFTAEVAHDTLLMIGNRKLCRHIVESTPVTGILVFEALAKRRRAGLPLGQFAKNISTEAIFNKDSALYQEDEGFSAGLTGYLKSFSRAVYGNYWVVNELGERFGSPLDIRLELRFKWDADQVQAYGRSILLTFEDYLASGRWGQQSYVLNRAFGNIRSATDDLYRLDKSESYYSNDISMRLQRTLEFLQAVVEQIDQAKHFPKATLRTRGNLSHRTLYDTVAETMCEIIFHASAVNTPFFTSWEIQYVLVWDAFFSISERTPAWKIVQFKLKRLLYKEIRQLDRNGSIKAARILGFCLNVMGLEIVKGDFGKEYRSLQKAVIKWTQSNYLRLRHQYPKTANACLVGSLTYDADHKCIVKTYAEGWGPSPSREYLRLDQEGSFVHGLGHV
jgi:hypothetical protein